MDPCARFHSHHYLRHTARRLEHLASLRIPVSGSSVLEVGSGIGDHSHFYLDRGCKVLITEVRPENLQLLRERYPRETIAALDMENPRLDGDERFDVVHCYGLLYHLAEPAPALEFMASRCGKIMFLETCVSFGAESAINPVAEDQLHPTQASSGTGCRPTRPWLFGKLKELFEFVYIPKTQPFHEEFPLDWTAPAQHRNQFSRAVFVCSRERIANDILSETLLDRQVRE